MQLIKPGINIDFIGKRKLCYSISLALIVISLLSLVIHAGPRYGIDFAGGTLVQVKFQKEVDIAAIRAGLAQVGLAESSVQKFGKETDHEYLIRTSLPSMTDKGFAQSITEGLSASTGDTPEVRRVEMVGPQVGQDLRKKALLAIFFSLLFIAIYISGRFEQKLVVAGVTAGALMAAVYLISIFDVGIPLLITAALVVTLGLFWFLELKYAMGAIVALIHDVVITVGVFSVLDLEFTLPIIAALLTIIGYSLNDTIIVFDRIRENIRLMHKTDLPQIINRSVNETLSRTILTSGTTLIVLFCLLFLGGEIIHNFAFAMITGIVVGTYSSIYVASPILMAWNRK